MSLHSSLLAATPPLDWAGAAARPGSGLGLLPAALSAQPGAVLGALLLTALAAALALRRAG